MRIAHRGNRHGPDPEAENAPEYILEAIAQGFDVEVDIRGTFEGGLYLGHDAAVHRVTREWLRGLSERLWLHAKEAQTLCVFVTDRTTPWNVFWHEKDQCTVTTSGYIWTYPGRTLTAASICVLPESTPDAYTEAALDSCAGVCSDVAAQY